MTPLKTPVINLNGNAAEDLVRKLSNVSMALMRAREAMAEATDIVHGRNFQTSADPFADQSAAFDAWRERFAMIGAFEDEVNAMALAILDQKPRKRVSVDDVFSNPTGWMK